MNLGEGKRKVYELLDEYSSGGEITQDPDIELKMADFFDIAQKRVAQICRITAVRTITRKTGTTEYAMPESFAALRRVWRDGKPTKRYRWKHGRILIPEDDAAQVIEVEYFKTPETIAGDAPDDTEFEVSEAAAQCMPFYVAAQHLFPDLTVDYGVYLSEWNNLLRELAEMESGGGSGFVNTFYGG